MKRAILILGFLLIAGNAQAQLKEIRSGELSRWCKADDSTNIALCSGYFMGFLEYNSMVQVFEAYSYKGGKSHIITKNCIPPKVRNWDVVEAFLEYLASHPNQRNNWAYNIIRRSIEAKWPCEKNN